MLSIQVDEEFGLALAIVLCALAFLLGWKFRRRALLAILLCLSFACLALLSANLRLGSEPPKGVIVFAINTSKANIPLLQEDWKRIRGTLTQALEHNEGPVQLVYLDGTIRVNEITAANQIPSLAPMPMNSALPNAALLANYLDGVKLQQLFYYSSGSEGEASVAASVDPERFVYLRPSRRTYDSFRIHDMVAPNRAALNQSLNVEILVGAAQEGKAKIRLEGPDGVFLERALELGEDKPQVVDWDIPSSWTSQPGYLELTASGGGVGPDEFQENNQRSCRVFIGDAQPVLYVTRKGEDSRSREFYRLLEQRFSSIVVEDPSRLSGSAIILGNFQYVVLDNVPISAIPDGGASLEAAVRVYGTGLVVLGVEYAWGPGGYSGSILEEALPLRSDPKPETQHHHLLLLDASSSMNLPVNEAIPGGQRRFDALIDVAKVYVDALGENDLVAALPFQADVIGQAEFHSMSRTQKGETLNALRATRPGGETSVSNSLSSVQEVFKKLDGKEKRLFIVTDGTSKEPQDGIAQVLEALIAQETEITILVCAAEIPAWLEVQEAKVIHATEFQNAEKALRDDQYEQNLTLISNDQLIATGPRLPANLTFGVGPWVRSAAKSRGAAIDLQGVEPPHYPLVAHWEYGQGWSLGVALDMNEQLKREPEGQVFSRLLAEVLTEMNSKANDAHDIELLQRTLPEWGSNALSFRLSSPEVDAPLGSRVQVSLSNRNGVRIFREFAERKGAKEWSLELPKGYSGEYGLRADLVDENGETKASLQEVIHTGLPLSAYPASASEAEAMEELLKSAGGSLRNIYDESPLPRAKLLDATASRGGGWLIALVFAICVGLVLWLRPRT